MLPQGCSGDLDPCKHQTSNTTYLLFIWVVLSKFTLLRNILKAHNWKRVHRFSLGDSILSNRGRYCPRTQKPGPVTRSRDMLALWTVAGALKELINVFPASTFGSDEVVEWEVNAMGGRVAFLVTGLLGWDSFHLWQSGLPAQQLWVKPCQLLIENFSLPSLLETVTEGQKMEAYFRQVSKQSRAKGQAG